MIVLLIDIGVTTYISWFQFEALKELAKFVANSQESTINKKAPATPQYRGPLTSRKPVSMKNIQDWMVDSSFLQDDIVTCKSNRNPPFAPESISTLKRLFDTALNICSSGHEADGDETEPETQ